jgi:hypothetical protein
MRALNIDIGKAIKSIQSFILEFKSIVDLVEFLQEINELKDLIIENFKEALMASEIYYEEQEEIEKLLQEFLLRCEEQIQFDMNSLSSKVDQMESRIEFIDLRPSEVQLNHLNTPPHKDMQIPE